MGADRPCSCTDCKYRETKIEQFSVREGKRRRMASQPGQAAFVAGESSNPTSMVELSLSCNNLADMDTFSKSDPFAVLYLKDSRSGHWVYVDRTETIDNTLNPQWAKKFVLEFQFEKRQLMKIEVYDADSNSPNLTDHDF